jgi:hypothetical protein
MQSRQEMFFMMNSLPMRENGLIIFQIGICKEKHLTLLQSDSAIVTVCAFALSAAKTAPMYASQVKQMLVRLARSRVWFNFYRLLSRICYLDGKKNSW